MNFSSDSASLFRCPQPGRCRTKEQFLNTGYFLPPSPVTPFPAAGQGTNTTPAGPSKGHSLPPHGQPLHRLATPTGTHQKLQISSFHDDAATNMIPPKWRGHHAKYSWNSRGRPPRLSAAISKVLTRREYNTTLSNSLFSIR